MDNTSAVVLSVFVAILGLVIGSFLNVVIYRLPNKIPIGLSRSACPSCGATVRWYDNIPLVSFLALRGKCRACGVRISWRYPLIEVLTGGLFVTLHSVFGFTPLFGVMAILTSGLVAIFFIDVTHMIIPDKITLPGIIVGLALSFVPGGIGVVSALVGALVGGGALYAIALAGDFIFKKESMGGGDIKMAAMLGAFLGVPRTFLVFFLAAVIGLLASIALISFSSSIRQSRIIPFGPFLASAGFVALTIGNQLLDYYCVNFLGSTCSLN